MAVASVTYKADIKDLRKKLESVSDITRAEARKMVTDLNKSYKQMERSTKSAGVAMAHTSKASRDLSRATQSVAMQLPDVASQLAAGTPPMQVFTQQGLQVVQSNMHSLQRVAERFGLSMASIGPIMMGILPAVALAGAAYVVFSRQLEAAEASAAKAAKHAGALGKAHGQLEKQMADVSAELDLVTGVTDRYSLAQERRDTATRKAADSERQAAKAIRESALAELSAARGKDEITAKQAKLDQALIQYDRIMGGVAKREKDALQSSADIIEVQRERAESEEFLRKRAASRAKDEAAQAKAAAELLAMEKERAAASKQLAQIQASSSLAVLSGEERLTEELQRQLERINQLERTSKDADAASAARKAAAIQYEQQIGDLRARKSQQAAEEERRRIQETERARQVAMAQSLDMASSVAGAMSFGWGRAHEVMLEDAVRLQDYQMEAGEHLTKRQNRQLSKRIEDQKRAARNAFDVQQAAAASQAAVQTALAVATALGSAPWPASLIPAAGALAAGVAQQQAIARQRPTFHRGGGVDLAPDELTATVRRSEFVLNPTGRDMVGDGALHRANAGQSSGTTQNVIAVSVYKHTRQVDRWKRDGLSSGDPISRAIQRGQLVGHRSNR